MEIHAAETPDCSSSTESLPACVEPETGLDDDLYDLGITEIDPYAPISAWAVCPPLPVQDFTPGYTGPEEKAPTYLEGNLARHDAEGLLTLTGNAIAEHAHQRLKADHITYSDQDGVINAEGQVRYDEPGLMVNASRARIWSRDDRGVFHNTRYWFLDRHGRGSAEKSKLLEPGITRYWKALYTTCAEDSNAWIMRAAKVTLDENTGEGVSRHARLSIKGVPVLYSPYLSFPIDDRRKSGFLIPSFGTSDKSGFDLSLPYYLNLAPNYDATLTARHLEDRGAQLSTEFRYRRKNQDGTINYEILPNDDITDENRSRITVHDHTRFGKNLVTTIDYDRVSDSNYLTDLGDSLSLASRTHLPHTLTADYKTAWWQAGMRLDDYQTIDDSISAENRPYQRLPRFTFNARPPAQPFGLNLQLDTEVVRFDHDDNVTGRRTDLAPAVSLPIRRSAFEITPKMGLRHTRYKLRNLDSGERDDPARTTPLFSLDNTVFFERDFTLGTEQYMQTLEPRLFYLYVPGRNQEDQPLFDASEPTISYRELFQENRFNGTDRVGDANQATLALTTRFLHPESGEELLRASVGEIFFFDNRNVTLDDSPPLNNSRSDIAGEMRIALSRAWQGSADMVWDPLENQTIRSNARIQYNPGFRKIANVSYRFSRQTQSQIDTSVLWPLGPAWHVLGRWYYDLNDSQVLEQMIGIEYDSCCWGVRLVAREFLEDDEETNRIFMFQIVLKGLTHFGSNIENLLEDGILGYTQRPED